MSINMNGKLVYRMELSRGDRMKVAQHEVPGWGWFRTTRLARGDDG
jgi:hypothetical protein